MDTKLIEYVIAIAEEKSLSKAAERLYLSQPALSQRLKKLEDEGMQVVRFSDEQLKSFAEDVRANVWPEFESVYGADFMQKLQDALK